MNSQFSLVQIALGFRNLLDERRKDLVLCKAGQYFEPKLAEMRKDIDALPAALTGGKPLADDLLKVDLEHDGYGAVLWFTTEVVLRNPQSTAEDRAAALRIRAALITALGELQDSYAIEAHRAIERRPQLESLKADLQKFAVPGEKTLLETATRYLDAGDKLNALLDERGSVPIQDRSKAAFVRSRASGLLTRLRKDLVEEVEKDPSLPRDLEHRVFGYLDTLKAMKRGTATGNAEPAEPTNPA